jgi:hypothetical protein
MPIRGYRVKEGVKVGNQCARWGVEDAAVEMDQDAEFENLMVELDQFIVWGGLQLTTLNLLV